MQKNSVVIHPEDSVATALQPLKKGDTATMLIGKEIKSVKLRNDVPYGHKFVIKGVNQHEDVFKYGESIGRATEDLHIGDYAHIHNIESKRGRGDWS